MLLHLEFQELIPGASSSEITLRLVHVITHAPLFHFHAYIFKFSGQFFYLGDPK